MKKIEMEIQCKSCSGTGVYVGMAEREGAAVVCSSCNGTGKYWYEFEYEEFTGRKTKDGVTRVYKSSCGFCIAPKKIFFQGIGEVDLSEEGIDYGAFLAGSMPEHIKSLVCPMLADQGACHSIRGFVDECDRLDGQGSLIGRHLSRCAYQRNKSACWERFERESKKEIEQ